MICCTLLAMILGLIGWPARRATPLAWRPHAAATATARPKFSLAARGRSFGYALQGIADLVRREHNAWIHLAAATLVVAAGVALRVSLSDWRWLILAIALVLAAEALNTAIEVLCDLVQPDRHPAIKRIKDLAAGAVLLSAIAAALIGVATFLPYLGGATLPRSFCGSGINGY